METFVFCNKDKYFKSCKNAVMKPHSKTMQPVWYGIDSAGKHNLSGMSEEEIDQFKERAVEVESVQYYQCSKCQDEGIKVLNQMYEYYS